MNSFDEPVQKAETDSEILNALQGVKQQMDTLRKAVRDGEGSVSMALAIFRAYFDKLPEEVARRLTEINTEAVGHITRATALNLSGARPGAVRGEAGEQRRLRPGHPGGERVPGAAGLCAPRAGRLAGGGDMRKGTAKGARQLTGTVGRLAGVLAVNEIIRARRFLAWPPAARSAKHCSGCRSPSSPCGPGLTSAVCLRQQTETAEHTRELMAQQKAAQEPRKGPFAS